MSFLSGLVSISNEFIWVFHEIQDAQHISFSLSFSTSLNSLTDMKEVVYAIFKI